jgi:hypothetical protein
MVFLAEPNATFALIQMPTSLLASADEVIE